MFRFLGGPLAKYEETKLPSGANQLLLGVLNGIQPPQSKPVKFVGRPNIQGWKIGKTLFVRMKETALSPGWYSSMSAADDTMHAYEMPLTSNLVLDNGEMRKIVVEEPRCRKNLGVQDESRGSTQGNTRRIGSVALWLVCFGYLTQPLGTPGIIVNQYSAFHSVKSGVGDPTEAYAGLIQDQNQQSAEKALKSGEVLFQPLLMLILLVIQTDF